MDPRTDSSRAAQAEAERRLLVALCQNVLDSSARDEVMRRFRNHRFAHADHEVLYRALAALPRCEPAEVRAKLAQAVTRLGFPDIDFDALFDSPPPTPAELAALLKQLT
jgi:hypothetical protein